MHSHHFDSTVWEDFKFRNDDIVIATYAKSGTTWMQQILGQLIFNGDPSVENGLSPWLDLRVPPKDVKLSALEAQEHRRFVKTHLPVDALVFSPKAKYVFVARDGRDVAWSLHNHHITANDAWYDVLNKTPGLVGPPISEPIEDKREYFRQWFEKDGYPFWSFWENISSWWAIRHLPNVMLVHFNDLKTDLEGEIRRIASFLEIEIDETKIDDILVHCSFAWMRENGEKTAPLGGSLWKNGAKSFIHKGTNKRWSDTLTTEDCREYEDTARAKLGEECAYWLANGGRID